MASPQVERGSVSIACDLFAALAVADWPKREWIVLAEILLQVYGPQKRREAHVDPRTVEHYSGLSAKNVYRALKNLKSCGVIAETKSGGWRFLKDFEKWDYEAVEKVTGTPVKSRRLSPGDLRFALSANDRFSTPTPINISKSVGIQRDTADALGGIQRDTVSDRERYPTGYQNRAETVSNGIPATIGTGAPAPASEEFGVGELENPLSNDGGDTDTAKVTIKTLVDEARRLHGEGVAKIVNYHSSEILGNFGDRLDYYLAAIREAAENTKPIGRPHGWFLAAACRFRDKGSVPPEHAPIVPRKAASRSKAQDDAFERAVAELDEEP